MTSLPQVELTFGASNGAWDDRALITACDAAMAEFHAHHPGPGSWLDKATAAQLAGKPLEAIENTESPWYTASALTPNEAGPSRTCSPTSEAERPNKRIRRHKTPHQRADLDQQHKSTTNPYAPVGTNTARPDPGPSPRYAPTSPIAQDVPPGLPLDGLQSDFEVHVSSTQRTTHPPAPPSAGVSAVEGLSEQDATAYAMSSQYWAGYWMGVAQSMRYRRDNGQPQSSLVPASARMPEAEPPIVVTRRDFGQKPRDSLRR